MPHKEANKTYALKEKGSNRELIDASDLRVALTKGKLEFNDCTIKDLSIGNDVICFIRDNCDVLGPLLVAENGILLLESDKFAQLAYGKNVFIQRK